MVKDSLPEGTVGDMMDGLIVAMDHLNNFCKKLKYEKRIYLLTDQKNPMNFHGVDTIKESILQNGTQLILVDFSNDPTLQREGVYLI